MKAIIWIVILAIVAWGIWWFMKGSSTTATNNNAAAVEGASDVSAGADANVDLGAYDSKG